MRLVQLPGEPIDEELARARRRLGHDVPHGVLEQLHRDLHGDDEPVLDVVFDQVAEFGAGALLLCAQEVARREVREVVVSDEVGALCAFSCAGAAEHEEDGDFFRGEGWGGFGGGGELRGRRRHVWWRVRGCFGWS